MWNLLGLVGLVASAAAAIGLVAAAVIRRSHNWAAAIALAGLMAFLGSLAGEALAVGGAHQKAAMSALDGIEGREVGGPGARRDIICARLPAGRAATSTYRDGAFIYRLFSTKMYQGPVSEGGDRAGWVEIELLNASGAAAESRPWTDLWLTWQPVRTGSAFSPQPVRVDLVDMAGLAAVPAGAMVSVPSGMACLLFVTFQMQTEAERATLGVGYIGAFNIDLIDLRPANAGLGR